MNKQTKKVVAKSEDAKVRSTKHLDVKVCDTLDEIKFKYRKAFKAEHNKTLTFDELIIDMCKVYVADKSLPVVVPKLN